MQNIHLTENDLERYFLHRISSEGELFQIREHLGSCPQCNAHAEQKRRLILTIRQAWRAVRRSRELRRVADRVRRRYTG